MAGLEEEMAALKEDLAASRAEAVKTTVLEETVATLREWVKGSGPDADRQASGLATSGSKRQHRPTVLHASTTGSASYAE